MLNRFLLVAVFLLCACAAGRGVQAQSTYGGLITGVSLPDNSIAPVTPGTRAQTETLGISTGIGETDNVFLTPADKQAQTIALAEIDFGLDRTGSALDANISGNFNYLDYLQNAYGPELLGRMDALTSLSLWSDRLKWTLQDDFGEGQLNPFTPMTPSNLENVNYVSTGPELTLRPASATTLQVGAHYAYTTYQDSPFDGWRTIEDALLGHELSANSSIGLGAQLDQLRFQNSLINPDYDRNRIFLQYNATGARTTVQAAAGVAQSNDGGSSMSTPLLQLQLTRKLSQLMSLTISGGRELTDASDSFSALRTGAAGGIAVAAFPETTADYLRNYASAGLQLTGSRTTVNVTASYERDTYNINQNFNVTFGNLALKVDRKLSSVLTAEVFGTWAPTHYFDEGFQDDERSAGVTLALQATRTLQFQARYEHDFLSASGGGYGYSENIAYVTITYRPLQPQQPLQQGQPQGGAQGQPLQEGQPLQSGQQQ